MKKLLSGFVLMSCMTAQTVSAQQPKWCIPPVLVDFSGATPTTSSITTSSVLSYPKAANAAYDKNGNALFYVANGKIIQTNGTVVFNPSGSTGSSTEEGVVKVPGSCNRFYVLRTTNPPYATVHLFYNMVEVNSGTVSIVPGFSDVDLGPVSGEFAAIAISKLRPGNKRFLFTVGRASSGTPVAGVQRFLITSNGISFDAKVVNLSALSSENKPTEADLYEDPTTGNMKLAWNDYLWEGYVNILDMNSSGNYVSYTTRAISGASSFSGLEFYDNGNKLVTSYRTGTAPYGGLAVINIPANTYATIPSSSAYAASQIEKAIDGNYYAIGNYSGGTYPLGKIDPSALTVTSVLSLTNVCNYNGPTLPDQVDDEVYTGTANWAADLYMRDDASDIGVEPNTISPDIWNSIDLWNCRSSGGCTVHQNPGYLNPALYDNYARVKITNRGCSSSQPAVVRMYWTMGSTGETWPDSWNGVAKINSVSAGGEITTGGGIAIPSLSPGQSAIATQAWDPVNPAVFGSVSLANWADGKPMMCMLARIESASDPMYNEASGPIRDNVKNNNNIVTRNTSLLALNGSNPGPWTGNTGTVFVQNSAAYAAAFDLHFSGTLVAGTPYQDAGSVLITLSDELWNSWISGGQMGQGVIILDDAQHQVLLTDFQNATLGNIDIPAGEFRALSLNFYVNNPTAATSDYVLTVSQSWINDVGEVETGSECNFRAQINMDDGQDGGLRSISNNHSISGMATGNDISIIPNPASSNIYIGLPAGWSEATVYVMNALGQVVITQAVSELKTGIDINKLASGIYTVKAVHNGESKQKKFVKN